MMETATTPLTGEALAALGDMGPCELVEGEVIPMSPTNRPHGSLEGRLARLLGNFVDEHDLGDVSVGAVGIYTRRNPDTVRGAAIAFHSHEWLAQVQAEVYFDVAPELVIEILSPSDRW